MSIYYLRKTTIHKIQRTNVSNLGIIIIVPYCCTSLATSPYLRVNIEAYIAPTFKAQYSES